MDKHCHVTLKRLTKEEITKATKRSRKRSKKFSSNTGVRRKSSYEISSAASSKKKKKYSKISSDEDYKPPPAFKTNFLSNYNIPKISLRSSSSETTSSSITSNSNGLSSKNSHSSALSLEAHTLKERWKDKESFNDSKYEEEYWYLERQLEKMKWTHIHDLTLPRKNQNCVRCYLTMITSSEEMTFMDKILEIKRILRRYPFQNLFEKSPLLDALKMNNTESVIRSVPSIECGRELQSTGMLQTTEERSKVDRELQSTGMLQTTEEKSKVDRELQSTGMLQTTEERSKVDRELQSTGMLQTTEEKSKVNRKLQSTGMLQTTEERSKVDRELQSINTLKITEEKSKVNLGDVERVDNSKRNFTPEEDTAVKETPLSADEIYDTFIQKGPTNEILKGNSNQNSFIKLNKEFVEAVRKRKYTALSSDEESGTEYTRGIKKLATGNETETPDIEECVSELFKRPLIPNEKENNTVLCNEMVRGCVSENKSKFSNKNLSKDGGKKKILDTLSVEKSVVLSHKKVTSKSEEKTNNIPKKNSKLKSSKTFKSINVTSSPKKFKHKIQALTNSKTQSPKRSKNFEKFVNKKKSSHKKPNIKSTDSTKSRRLTLDNKYSKNIAEGKYQDEFLFDDFDKNSTKMKTTIKISNKDESPGEKSKFQIKLSDKEKENDVDKPSNQENITKNENLKEGTEKIKCVSNEVNFKCTKSNKNNNFANEMENRKLHIKTCTKKFPKKSFSECKSSTKSTASGKNKSSEAILEKKHNLHKKASIGQAASLTDENSVKTVTRKPYKIFKSKLYHGKDINEQGTSISSKKSIADIKTQLIKSILCKIHDKKTVCGLETIFDEKTVAALKSILRKAIVSKLMSHDKLDSTLKIKSNLVKLDDESDEEETELTKKENNLIKKKKRITSIDFDDFIESNENKVQTEFQNILILYLILEKIDQSNQPEANETIYHFANKRKSVDESIVTQISDDQNKLINNKNQSDGRKKMERNLLKSEWKSINNETILSSIWNTVNITTSANESPVNDLPSNQTENGENTDLMENQKYVECNSISSKSKSVKKSLLQEVNENSFEIADKRECICSSTEIALVNDQAKLMENILEAYTNLEPTSISPECELVYEKRPLNEKYGDLEILQIIFRKIASQLSGYHVEPNQKRHPRKTDINKTFYLMSLKSDPIQKEESLSQNLEGGEDSITQTDLLPPELSKYPAQKDVSLPQMLEGGRESTTQSDLVPPKLFKYPAQKEVSLTQMLEGGSESTTQIDLVPPELFKYPAQKEVSLPQMLEGGRENTTQSDLVPPELSKYPAQKEVSLPQMLEGGRESTTQKYLVPPELSKYPAQKEVSLTQMLEGGRESTTQSDLVPPELSKYPAQKEVSLTQMLEGGNERRTKMDQVLPELSNVLSDHSDFEENEIEARTQDIQHEENSLLSLKHMSARNVSWIKNDIGAKVQFIRVNDVESTDCESFGSQLIRKQREDSQNLNHEIKEGTEKQKEKNISEISSRKMVPLDNNKYALQEKSEIVLVDREPVHKQICNNQMQNPSESISDKESNYESIAPELQLKNIEDEIESLETESKSKNLKHKEIYDCTEIHENISKDSITPNKTSSKTDTELSIENYEEYETNMSHSESNHKNVKLTSDENYIHSNIKSLSSEVLYQSDSESTSANIEQNNTENEVEIIKNKNYIPESSEIEISVKGLNIVDINEISEEELSESEMTCNKSMINQSEVDTDLFCRKENGLREENDITLNQNKSTDESIKEGNLETKSSSEERDEKVKQNQTINCSENVKKKYKRLSILRKTFSKSFSRFSSKKGYFHCKSLYKTQRTNNCKIAIKNNFRKNNSMVTELNIQSSEEIVNGKNLERNTNKPISEGNTDVLNLKQNTTPKFKAKMTSTAKRSTQEVKEYNYECEKAASTSNHIVSDSSVFDSEVTGSRKNKLNFDSSESEMNTFGESANQTLPKFTEEIGCMDEMDVTDFEQLNMNVSGGKRGKELNSIIKFLTSKALFNCKNESQDFPKTNSSLLSNKLPSEEKETPCEDFIPTVKVNMSPGEEFKSKISTFCKEKEETNDSSQNESAAPIVDYQKEAEKHIRPTTHVRKSKSSRVLTEKVINQGQTDNLASKDSNLLTEKTTNQGKIENFDSKDSNIITEKTINQGEIENFSSKDSNILTEKTINQDKIENFASDIDVNSDINKVADESKNYYTYDNNIHDEIHKVPNGCKIWIPKTVDDYHNSGNKSPTTINEIAGNSEIPKMTEDEYHDIAFKNENYVSDYNLQNDIVNKVTEVSQTSALVEKTFQLCSLASVQAAENATSVDIQAIQSLKSGNEKPLKDNKFGCNELIQTDQKPGTETNKDNFDGLNSILTVPMEVFDPALQINNHDSADKVKNKMVMNSDNMTIYPSILPGSNDVTQNLQLMNLNSKQRSVYLDAVHNSSLLNVPNIQHVPLSFNTGESDGILSSTVASTDHHDKNTKINYLFPGGNLTAKSNVAAIPVVTYSKSRDDETNDWDKPLQMYDPSYSSDFRTTDDPSIDKAFERKKQLAKLLLSSGTAKEFDINESRLGAANENREFQVNFYSGSSNNKESFNRKTLKYCPDQLTAEVQDDAKLDHIGRAPEISSQKSKIVFDQKKATEDLNSQMDKNLNPIIHMNSRESSSNNQMDTDINKSSVLNLKYHELLKPKLNHDTEKSIVMKDFPRFQTEGFPDGLTENVNNPADINLRALKENRITKNDNRNEIVHMKESLFTEETMSTENEANITTNEKELINFLALPENKNLSADSLSDIKNALEENCDKSGKSLCEYILLDEEDIPNEEIISKDEMSQYLTDGEEIIGDSPPNFPSDFHKNINVSHKSSKTSTHQKILNEEGLKDVHKRNNSPAEDVFKFAAAVMNQSSSTINGYDRHRLILDFLKQHFVLKQDSNRNRFDRTTDSESIRELKDNCSENIAENCNLAQLPNVENLKSVFGSNENAPEIILEYMRNNKLSVKTNAQEESKGRSFSSSLGESESKNVMIVSEQNTVSCSSASKDLMATETTSTSSLSPASSLISEATAAVFEVTPASSVGSKPVLPISSSASISAFETRSDENSQEQSKSHQRSVSLPNDFSHSRPPIIQAAPPIENVHISHDSLHISVDKSKESSAESNSQKKISSHTSTGNKKTSCDTMFYSSNVQNHSATVHVHPTLPSENHTTIPFNTSTVGSASNLISHFPVAAHNSNTQISSPSFVAPNPPRDDKYYQQHKNTINLHDSSPKHPLLQEKNSLHGQSQNDVTKTQNPMHPISTHFDFTEVLNLSSASTEPTPPSLQKETAGPDSAKYYGSNSSIARASISHREGSSQITSNITLPPQHDTRGATAQSKIPNNLAARNVFAQRNVPPDSSSQTVTISKTTCISESSVINSQISQTSNTNSGNHLLNTRRKPHPSNGYLSSDQEEFPRNLHHTNVYLQPENHVSDFNNHRNSGVSSKLPIKNSMPIWQHPASAMLTSTRNFHVQNIMSHLNTNQCRQSVQAKTHQFQVPYSHNQHPCFNKLNNQVIINPENPRVLQHNHLMQNFTQNYYGTQHSNTTSPANVSPDSSTTAENYGKNSTGSSSLSSEKITTASPSDEPSFKVDSNTSCQTAGNISNSNDFIPVAVPNFPPQFPISGYPTGIPQRVPVSSLPPVNQFVKVPFPCWYDRPHMLDQTQVSFQEEPARPPTPPCDSCGNPSSLLCLHCRKVSFCSNKCVTDRRCKGAKHFKNCKKKQISHQ